MRCTAFFFLLMAYGAAFAQADKLDWAIRQMQLDSQYTHATIALMVKDAETGKTVFERNADVGVVPASSLKVLTSASAFDLLGSDFRFKTQLSIAPSFLNNQTAMYITGWGDPSLGSTRWDATGAEKIFQQILLFLQKQNIHQLPGGIFLDDVKMGYMAVPNGWLYEDMGNYFGAGHYGINWKENVFEIDLKPGLSVNDSVEVLSTRPYYIKQALVNLVKTGAKGTGDRTIVYTQPYGSQFIIAGKAGAASNLTVKGAHPNPASFLANELVTFLNSNGITSNGVFIHHDFIREKKKMEPAVADAETTIFSPEWRMLNEAFMEKSINLYGEAVIKQIASVSSESPTTELGMEKVIEHWSGTGIDCNALQIVDGSGLSPVNRITARALVQVLSYAKTRPWYNDFLSGIPTMNGMKLKSGYMRGVRSYTGMVTARSGKKYWVAFVVNNFSGSPTTVRQRMWRVLDLLK